MTTGDAGAADRFRTLAAVKSVVQEGLELTISGTAPDMVARVIRLVAEHQIGVIDFRTERKTLEDVFLTLTGHRIRD
jgi:hypothetical protein